MADTHAGIQRQTLQGRQVHRGFSRAGRCRLGGSRGGFGGREQLIDVDLVGIQLDVDLRRLEAVDAGLQCHVGLVEQGRQVGHGRFLLDVGRHRATQLQRGGGLGHGRILDVDLTIQFAECVTAIGQAGLHRRGQFGGHGTAVLLQRGIQSQTVDLQVIGGPTDPGQRQRGRQPFLVAQAHLGLHGVTRGLVAGNGQTRCRHRGAEAVGPHAALGIHGQLVHVDDRPLRIEGKALELERELLHLQRVDGPLQAGTEIAETVLPLVQIDGELAAEVEIPPGLGRAGAKAELQ